MKLLFGTKLGMTRMFDADGRARGVTAIQVLPTTVSRLKSADGKDGYEAMVVSAGVRKKVGKSVLGQTKQPVAVLKEFPKSSDAVKIGDTLGLDQFAVGDLVVVTATSKGKGFQGTVKRHNFSRGPKTHGSRNYRAPGSIAGTGAARVFPGQPMPGRMGAQTVSTKNQRVAAIHADDGVLLLHGAVPGAAGRTVIVRAKTTEPPAEESA